MLEAEDVAFAGVEAHGSGVKGVVILGGADFLSRGDRTDYHRDGEPRVASTSATFTTPAPEL